MFGSVGFVFWHWQLLIAEALPCQVAVHGAADGWRKQQDRCLLAAVGVHRRCVMDAVKSPYGSDVCVMRS